MNKQVKFLSIVLAAAVCVSLTACSESEKTNNSTSTTASEATTTTTSDTTSATTTTTSATTSATTTTTSATTKATTTTTSTTASTSMSTAGSDNPVELPYDIDTVGTLTRNGEKIKVCICHDTEAIYIYRDNENTNFLTQPCFRWMSSTILTGINGISVRSTLMILPVTTTAT